MKNKIVKKEMQKYVLHNTGIKKTNIDLLLNTVKMHFTATTNLKARRCRNFFGNILTKFWSYLGKDT